MKLRVLLVDDESLARSRLTTLLGDCVAPGAVVSAEAADAKQAMNALKLGSFDVVLLDIRMPGIDGITLAQTIAVMPQPPAVVFVTAHSEHAVKAFELEAIDYLTKPVRLERLQQTLQKVSATCRQNGGWKPIWPTMCWCFRTGDVPNSYRCQKCCTSKLNSNTSPCAPPCAATYSKRL